MFCFVNDSSEKAAEYIKSVTYVLHPMHEPNILKATEAPFLFGRLSFDIFEMQVLIEFKPSTGI